MSESIYIPQKEPYDCAPIATFNAIRHFYPNTPYYVFEDVRKNMKTSQRNVDYGRNDYVIGTQYHDEWLVIKELEFLNYWTIIKDEIANAGQFCTKMYNRILKLMDGNRVCIIRGDVDQTKLKDALPSNNRKMREMVSDIETKQAKQTKMASVHCWLITNITNRHACCINLCSELSIMIPTKALLINGYWILEKKD